MLRHNLLFILRSFRRDKSTFIINLIGLSTGIACAFLIYLWVDDELSMDKFHARDQELFQVMVNRQNAGEIITQPHGPGMLAQALKEELPEVEYALSSTQAFRKEKDILSFDDTHVKVIGDYVGSDFFRMFSFNLIEGNKDQVLSDNSSIAISRSTAIKLFGTPDHVLGRQLQLNHNKVFQVSGLFEDVSDRSTYRFDYLLPYDAFAAENQWMLSWNNNAPGNYVVLRKGTDLQVFNDKIRNFVKGKQRDSNVTLFARPFSDGYLYDKYQNGVLIGGRIEYIRLLSAVAIFVLLIACVNFMNLSTAKVSKRVKELGVKKIIGADRLTIVFQSISESVVMATLALGAALILVAGLLPQFNIITGKNLVLSFNLRSALSLLSLTLFTGLISGSYPAWYLSRFNSAAVVKGSKFSNTNGLWIRKGLVVFQFFASVILIVSVIVVYQQISFIQTKHLGYEKDNVITFQREGRSVANLEEFLSELKVVPGVINASSMMENFVDGKTSTYEVDWAGKDPNEKIDFQFRVVGFDLIETLKIDLSEGRTFSSTFNEDSTVIVNETAVKLMGMKDPLHQSVRLFGKQRTIIGVTKDFQFASLYEEVKPLFFIVDRGATSTIMARIQSGTEEQTIRKLNDFYSTANPGYAFDFKFLDEDYQALYQSEKRVTMLSRYFAGLAMLISCLGLSGLVAFTADQRLREIGIRKILGSSIVGIIKLLSVDFTRTVMVAIILALPVSYFISRHWLNEFRYRISLEWWFFAGTGMFCLLITWMIIAVQMIKVARVNPLKCVNTEQ
ncbi:ABC transporter permease [Chryseolinea sp. T2]|uniref:ABC transporter permease n=1 Tax=Chryseolinea sp. T2 TaxID=3129255 RepID=UPI0030770471